MKYSKEQIKTKGDEMGLDWNKYNLSELVPGVDVELEHGTEGNWNITNDDLEATIKIALAHLDELPDYYTRLDKMEKEGKIQNESYRKVKKTIEKFRGK